MREKKAHWFDMPKFWESMAKVVKPGGSVALWSVPNVHCRESCSNFILPMLKYVMTDVRREIAQILQHQTLTSYRAS